MQSPRHLLPNTLRPMPCTLHPDAVYRRCEKQHRPCCGERARHVGQVERGTRESSKGYPEK